MDNAVYVTLSRQLALVRDLDVTANNLANANTTGFNASHIMFSTYLAKDPANGPLAMANDANEYRDTTKGDLQSTGNPLDVAINGPGYFQLETPLGPRYTRAGNFQVDGTGTLVSVEGYPVLDQTGQHIAFNPEDSRVTIGTAGNITVNGEERATIAVVDFPNPQMMTRLGSRLYSTAQTPAQVPVPAVVQGVLEGANLKPVLEITHIMDITHAVSDTAQMVSALYDLESKTATTWTQQVS
ncbi:MAG: flagellar basal-body rod protein FlgF [Alphaproteobacteria bacterium]|nr:flagellar basal-body rod protein FlgF [Alphaproteobacteria bacterium]